MQILKQQIKKDLSNKILKSQVGPYSVQYTFLNMFDIESERIKKKLLPKNFINKYFSKNKTIYFLYPVYYISSNSLSNFITILNKFKTSNFIKNLLVCNVKINTYFYKNVNLALYFLNNNFFYKIFALLNFHNFLFKRFLKK